MFFDGKPDLLREFRKGERTVLRDVYSHYGEVLYRFCRDRLKSAADARDLAQETFIVAFREETRLRFSGTSSFQGFLLGIAKNLMMHRFRADRVRAEGTQELARSAEVAEPPQVDHRLEEEAVAKVLTGFLAQLSERDREFFARHMVPRPARRVTADSFKMSEDQVRYLEKKLKEKAIEYLKRTGYLDVAGADLQKAAAAALVLFLSAFPTSAGLAERTAMESLGCPASGPLRPAA
jgi:RNA polymerase sigma-70 factor (ECF subfamily)